MLEDMKKTKGKSFGKSSTVHLLKTEEEDQMSLLNVVATVFISAVKDGFWSSTSMHKEKMLILGNAGSLIQDVTWQLPGKHYLHCMVIWHSCMNKNTPKIFDKTYSSPSQKLSQDSDSMKQSKKKWRDGVVKVSLACQDNRLETWK